MAIPFALTISIIGSRISNDLQSKDP